MKIKVCFGVDTRLWRHGQNLNETVVPQLFDNLMHYIIETFNLKENGFLIQVIIENNEIQSLQSQKDFESVIANGIKANQKSIKIHVIELNDSTTDNDNNDNDNEDDMQMEEEDNDEKDPVTSTLNDYDGPGYSDDDDGPFDQQHPSHPNREEMNAFLQNPEIMALVSDLMCDVLVALRDIGFEITFIECLNGVLLSDSEKYSKLTEHKVWAFFVGVLLEKYVHKIEHFLVPLVKMHGQNGCNNPINVTMIKAWVPPLMNMIVNGYQNHHYQPPMGPMGPCFSNGFGNDGSHWRGGHHGWRGRWGGHRHGRHGYGHGHGHGHGHGGHGRWGKRRCGGGGGGKGRRYGRKHGHKKGGHRGRHGYHHGRHHYGHGYEQAPPQVPFEQGPPPPQAYHHGYYHAPPAVPPHCFPRFTYPNSSAPQEAPRNNANDGDNNNNINNNEFQFTEELSEIMGMGFNDLQRIKQLLNENNGNKQRVVQQLIASN